MRLLALDCAAGTCAVACLADDDCLAAASEPMLRGHAERVAPMMADALGAAGLGPQDVDAVAVTVGPGAFTGIRIGLSAARGFALARGLPVLGVSCLEVAVAPLEAGRRGLAVLETKRLDYYLQGFDADKRPLTEPAALPAAAVADFLPAGPWTAIGDAAARLTGDLGRGADLTLDTRRPENTALAAARIATRRLRAGAAEGELSPRPLYLRPPDVNLKGRGPSTAAPQ